MQSALETGVRILTLEGEVIAERGFAPLSDQQMGTPQVDQIWMKIKIRKPDNI